MIEKEETLQKVGMEGTYLNMLCVCQSLSSDLLLAIPQTVAFQAPLSMELSRQEYWSGLPFPSPGDLLDSGIESGSPALQADSLPSEVQGKPNPCIQSSKTDNLLCQRSEQWKEYSVILGRRVRYFWGSVTFNLLNQEVVTRLSLLCSNPASSEFIIFALF